MANTERIVENSQATESAKPRTWGEFANDVAHNPYVDTIAAAAALAAVVASRGQLASVAEKFLPKASSVLGEATGIENSSVGDLTSKLLSNGISITAENRAAAASEAVLKMPSWNRSSAIREASNYIESLSEDPTAKLISKGFPITPEIGAAAGAKSAYAQGLGGPSAAFISKGIPIPSKNRAIAAATVDALKSASSDIAAATADNLKLASSDRSAAVRGGLDYLKGLH